MRVNASLEDAAVSGALVVCDQVDLETVRLPFERDALAMLIAHPAYRRSAAKWEAFDRRDASRDGIPLTRRAAPGLFALADEARRVLGIEEAPQLVQTAMPNPNASIAFTPGQAPLIQLHGPLISRLRPMEVLAVIGHELGHHIAHRDLGFRRPLGSLVGALSGEDPDGDELLWALFGLVQIGQEFLADRFALLCCQDIDAELGVEMAFTAGLPSSEIGLSPAEYLEQCRSFVDDMIDRGELHPRISHPEHNVRVTAAWLFSESDVFLRLTGQGGGQFSMDEVNAGISAVIETEALEYEWAHDDQAVPQRTGGLLDDIGSLFRRTANDAADKIEKE